MVPDVIPTILRSFKRPALLRIVRIDCAQLHTGSTGRNCLSLRCIDQQIGADLNFAELIILVRLRVVARAGPRHDGSCVKRHVGCFFLFTLQIAELTLHAADRFREIVGEIQNGAGNAAVVDTARDHDIAVAQLNNLPIVGGAETSCVLDPERILLRGIFCTVDIETAQRGIVVEDSSGLGRDHIGCAISIDTNSIVPVQVLMIFCIFLCAVLRVPDSRIVDLGKHIAGVSAAVCFIDHHELTVIQLRLNRHTWTLVCCLHNDKWAGPLAAVINGIGKVLVIRAVKSLVGIEAVELMIPDKEKRLPCCIVSCSANSGERPCDAAVMRPCSTDVSRNAQIKIGFIALLGICRTSISTGFDGVAGAKNRAFRQIADRFGHFKKLRAIAHTCHAVGSAR